ncbi:MAG: protein-glutamate O-methyltransferase CheR [Desulfovibrionaceae bacterium]
MSADPSEINENESIELELLLEAVYRKYGYDFRGYSRAHLMRRARQRMLLGGLGSISELTHAALNEPEALQTLLTDLSINVTEMFRDPEFYLHLRREIAPILRTYPFLKIWHAGCSTGEEVYSMSVLLEEEGLLDRARLYATDFNDASVEQAREGIYPVELIQAYTRNYQKAGGLRSFCDYYTARYDAVIMAARLRRNAVFTTHNLATDGPFGEMHLIVCRNVLIYFNRELQNKVVRLFGESLIPGGFLCLGSKESLKFCRSGELFEPAVESQRIFRRRFDTEPS